MDNFQTIELKLDDGVAHLTLNRPEKRNALNEMMIDEIHHAATLIGGDDSVRVAVLASRGQSFCAGGDLSWMQAQMNTNRQGKIEQSRRLAMMLRELDELPKPLIGRIQGPAYGGGIGLISVCDMAIAASDTVFALTETRLGLIPATIGPYVVRKLGEANARQVFMNGQTFTSQRACQLGLIASVVAASALDQAVMEQVKAYMSCAPGAVAQAKTLCRQLSRNPHLDHLDMTANMLADRWETAEAAQGIDAFFRREKPPWTRSWTK